MKTSFVTFLGKLYTCAWYSFSATTTHAMLGLGTNLIWVVRLLSAADNGSQKERVISSPGSIIRESGDSGLIEYKRRVLERGLWRGVRGDRSLNQIIKFNALSLV